VWKNTTDSAASARSISSDSNFSFAGFMDRVFPAARAP
jgi:hypothetical protein